MLFDSGTFALFIITVLLLWPFVQGRPRNAFLLIASYIFYGAWDWRFCFLLALSTIVDYTAALAMERTDSKARRRAWLTLSIVVNLSILGTFKYLNFFYDSTKAFLNNLGYTAPDFPLQIVLPVGISFYTFQSMAYSIDVYRRQIKPTRKLLDFALYVAFFPQLVAGPIERAARLLPQLQSPQKVYEPRALAEGTWLVLWGFYKKVFVADNLGLYVDTIFATPDRQIPLVLMIALYCFAMQLYCDFSGYTDIARGIARILGFHLSLNFNLPYFSQGPAEFWRRWHITLSEWVRDYIFIPLGGSRGSFFRVSLVLLTTMGLMGLWHGASFNFILWGLTHGVLLIVYRLIPEPALLRNAPSGLRAGFHIMLWMFIFCLTLIPVRAPDFDATVLYFTSLFAWEFRMDHTVHGLRQLIVMSWFVIVVQIFQWRSGDLLCVLRWSWPVKALIFLLLYFSITIGGSIHGRPFIYFQF